MAKIIDITIDNKNYVIEFDRSTVGRFMELQAEYEHENTSDVQKVVDILWCGLLKHHEKTPDMPSKEELSGWLIALDNVEGLFVAISECVQDVLDAVKKGRQEGNAKWGLRK